MTTDTIIRQGSKEDSGLDWVIADPKNLDHLSRSTIWKETTGQWEHDLDSPGKSLTSSYDRTS